MTDHLVPIASGRFLDLVQRQRWEYVRRRNASAVVGIVAVTPEGEVILVEQHRIPVDATVIELPAGLVGDGEQADEDLVDAARRELEEETGYTAASMRVLNRGPSSSGLTDEVLTLLMAEGVRRVGKGGGVEGEDIITHLVPLAEATTWLADRARAGALIDHKVHAGLWWIARSQA